MTPRPPLMTMTPAALQQVRSLMQQRAQPAAGVRIGIRTRGCSGLAYTLEYADQKGPADEMLQQEDVTIFIDPKAIMFILGTVMDFVDQEMQAGFVFTNPNEKGRCGCGQSFHV